MGKILEKSGKGNFVSPEKWEPRHNKQRHYVTTSNQAEAPRASIKCYNKLWNYVITRMHSSRICTTCSLTVSHSIPCILGAICPALLDADCLGCRPPRCRLLLDWMQTPLRMQTPFPMHAEKPTPLPTPGQKDDWNTPVKTLPCPKLRLRVVISSRSWKCLISSRPQRLELHGIIISHI